jgi:hypothetical protein
MKERLVKGTNLVEVVRLLRSHQHTRPLPEMGAWEQDLLRKRVAPSTWYSLNVFDSLLQMAHRFVFDGSESAAQNMGRRFASTGLSSGKGMEVVSGEPLATLQRFPDRWRLHFNFGSITVQPWRSGSARPGAQLQVTGYPDMSACHGQCIIGWTMQMAEAAGATNISCEVEERPWMHNSVLTYCLSWD